MVEINCPADCGYLAIARSHPPAVVQRQQDMDRATLVPLMQDLSERQARLFLILCAATAQHRGQLLQTVIDQDIVDAAGALASTLETAARGIVYEHQPTSAPAARLVAELRALVTEMAKNAGAAIERDAAIALRRIEQAAQTMVSLRGNTNEFQQMLGRLLAPPQGERVDKSTASPGAAPSLIIP
jgi:hypothetical protein